MSRILLTSFVILTTLLTMSVVPGSTGAQPTAPNQAELATSNQVYVKIILPVDPPPLQLPRDKDRPVVESWIGDQLQKRGRHRFSAATPWVPVAEKGEQSTAVWDGTVGDKQWGCPVSGEIVQREKGRVKVRLDGWAPFAAGVTVSLRDEPGSRKIAPLEAVVPAEGLIYVAVIIGPPPRKPDATAGRKR